MPFSLYPFPFSLPSSSTVGKMSLRTASVPTCVQLSCDNFTLNRIYQSVAGWTLLGSDFILIFISYIFILRAVLKFKAEGAAVKALSMCGSHSILILFFSTVLLVVMLTDVARKSILVDTLILLNVLHHFISLALNPIVYGVQTKEIKQGIQKLLQRGM